MSITNSLKKGGIWQAFEVVSQGVMQFVFFAIMARLLVKEDYGLMAIANAIVGVGSIFIYGGFGTALIQRQNLTNKHVNGALQISFLLGLFFFLFFYMLSNFIGNFYNDNRLYLIVKVVAINFIFLSISNVALNLLHKNLSFKKASLVTIIALVIGYSIGVCLAFLNYGVWALIASNLITTILKAVGFFVFAKINIIKSFCFKEVKELFSFSFGMILLSVSNYVSNNGLNLVLGKIFSPALLGVFDRASLLKTLPSQIVGSIMDKVMFPVMAKLQDEEIKITYLFKFGMGLSNSIMIPIAVMLLLFAPEIILLLMGDDWNEVVMPLQIMAIVLPFSNAGRLADSIVRAKGLVYRNVSRKYIFTVLVLVTTITLGLFYGVIGAALGITISYFVNYLMMLILVNNIVNESIVEIIYKPLKTGMKLGFVVCVSILLYKYALGLWENPNIFCFLFFLLIALLVTLLILKFKPKLFGVYINVTLEKLFNKKLLQEKE